MNSPTAARLNGPSLLTVVCVGLGLAAAGCSRAGRVAAPPPRPNLAAQPAALLSAIAAAETLVRDRPDPTGLMQLGQLYHANGFTDAARSCYSPLSADSAAGAKASYYLADLAAAAGDLEQATQWLNETVRKTPDYLPAQLRLAETRYKSGDAAGAVVIYNTVLQREPANADALLALARERLRTGDAAGAATLLEKLTTTHPNFGAGCALFAQVLEQRGDRARAALMQEKARAHKDPPSPDPWMDEVMAQCFDVRQIAMRLEDGIKSGRVDESMTWLKRLETLAPQHWLVCEVRGLAFAQQGRLDEAVGEYERGISAGGDPRKLFPALVTALTELKRFPEAEARARTGLLAAPHTPALLVALAQLRQRAGETDDAVRLLDEALAVEPRHAEANRARALIWWSQGQPEKALPLLRIVMDAAPGDLATCGMLGQYFLEKGNLDEALPPLERARAIDPKNESIAELLALAHLRSGNRDARAGKFIEALAAYDRALALRPRLAEAYANKAQVCAQLGQFAAAAETLEKLTAVQPDHAQPWLALGDMQRAAGHEQAARASWSKALALLRSGDDPALRAALAQRLQMAGAR